MHPIFDIDWHGLLVPTVSLLELVLRGSAIYLGILVLMRVLRRDAGALSTADLLVVVLIADAGRGGRRAGQAMRSRGGWPAQRHQAVRRGGDPGGGQASRIMSDQSTGH